MKEKLTNSDSISFSQWGVRGFVTPSWSLWHLMAVMSAGTISSSLSLLSFFLTWLSASFRPWIRRSIVFNLKTENVKMKAWILDEILEHDKGSKNLTNFSRYTDDKLCSWSVFSMVWLSSDRRAGMLEDVGFSSKKLMQRCDRSPILERRELSSEWSF